MKTIINPTNKYLIKDESKDFHSEFGVIKKEDLNKSKVLTNTNKEFSIFDARFADIYEKIRRKAQIITLKDIGTIISQTAINYDSIILEAGTGSGALSCFLGNICKKVVSYDIREDHQKTAKENIELLNLKNIELKIGDIRQKIYEKNVDVVILDLVDPWNALEQVAKALKKGGFLVIYSPTIPQIMDTVSKINKELKDKLIVIRTIETIQREWEVDERRVRPKSSYINHTGFLTFIRRV